MIQIYRVGNTNYEKNGDMTLFPTEAYLHVVLNGSWEAAIEHPIDIDGRWKYITEDAVVKMPSFNGNQLFRIKKKEKMDSGISATLEPIFMDAKDDCFLVDVRPTAKNGQQALDILCASNKKYSGVSNITKATTSYYILKNLIEAINGEDENSFIKRWGGEILFNNFQVIVNERVGGDYGVELRYGKNIAKDGLTEEVDIREVVTRIYPKAYNGYMMSNNGYVNSPLINNYQTTKTAVITFEDVKMRADAQEEDEEKGIIICDTQQELDAALTEKCRQQYNLGLDKPKVTISADLVLLQNTDLYKDYVVLEQVSLGDTIHCKHNKLGIITDARVIELEYDSIRKKVRSIVLGDFKTDFFDHVSSSTNKIDGVIRPDGTLMGEKVAGILNAINTQLRLQNTVAKKQNVRAILFEDLDPDSALYGAMALGTQGFQIAKKRTEDGRDWQWETAATAEGIVANAVITGILSDRLGKNYWNFDTGEFQLSSQSFQIDDQNVKDYVNGKIDAKKLTQSEVFNILTNNGKLQGIFMKDGQLYINGTYIAVTDWSELSKTLSGFKLSVKRIYGTDGTYCNGMSIGADNIYCFWAGETNGKQGSGNTDAPFLVSRNGTVWSKRLYAGDCLDLYESTATWKGTRLNIFREDGSLRIRQNHHDYGDTKVLIEQQNGEAQLVFPYASSNHGTVYFYSGYNSRAYLGLYHAERGGSGGAIFRYEIDEAFHMIARMIAGQIECTSLTQTSSEKIKKNIEELDKQKALDLIRNTKIYQYFLREQKDEDGNIIDVSKKQQFGAVIEKGCPDEFVSDDGESINLYSMIATCIAAIQKQQEEIDILKKGGL